ncbi:hypothetical protein [Pseudomonas sp. CFBP 13710]|uniref:hypothetical protein n=1 Tax=Pseudomonas sp. CFBP 13710 TaxID=2775311 RepID=UPI00178226E7|nr:hypothetical protein [Pseudomonas sp. CFBP 13710]MBD8729762.1 hypothetical protein [Pseudomonas sp. CFBP 13710]
MLEHFESLGDNCEFGFVQRHNGCEPGGLLRWATVPHESLIKALKSRFSKLYQYASLSPVWDDMVRDEEYGIGFHTNLRSNVVNGKRQYILGNDECTAIYAEEQEKIKYLRQKLIEQLNDASKIFVYKTNYHLQDSLVKEIFAEMKAYNENNELLFVSSFTDQNPGTVWKNDSGIICASIDRFAPYDKADDVSYDLWSVICQRALALIGKDFAAGSS